ncbi:hypothetical protein NCCP691_21930 [Noviherbaspirillum aridicola]|uniref:Uncharacterized protein n=1 Tax=Noviherbaspirillum aridicola TaxID=2849687 RepID=A0ABQ4Q4Z5_9BURK|nr:hypothetical protein NCCP691_21930 [Noviherbaspirillum aridicola]
MKAGRPCRFSFIPDKQAARRRRGKADLGAIAKFSNPENKKAPLAGRPAVPAAGPDRCDYEW